MDTRLGQDDVALNGWSDSVAMRPNERDARAQVQQSPGEYAEEYPAYCKLLQDIPAIPRYNVADSNLDHVPPGNSDSGWQNCLNSVEKYDRELCQAYREQIDTLLVFAGLFSAVVTAFAVESYQWLQDDPTDTSVELLRDVVGLLSQDLNLTVPLTPDSSHHLSGAAVVRINSFWFLSLSLSLSAALVGILCKQWLREYERNVGQSPETALAVRYVRFQGFEFWRVGSIVTSVPILMQVALAFFIIGIVELLWLLSTIVASCVTVIAGLTLAFYLATTLLPAAQYAYICMRCYLKPIQSRDYPRLHAFTEPQCAFKSAQAWLAFRIAEPVINRLLKAAGYQFSPGRPPAFFEQILRPADSWVEFDLNWIKCRDDIHAGPRCAFESLAWIAGNLGEMHMSSWIWHCIWARWLKTRDQSAALRLATTEIASVARSYPGIVAVDDANAPLVRSQALIFQCSLRADLPITTALELLLRVATSLGANSRWTQEALNKVRIVYHGMTFRFSDDIAIGLFRLAELQTHAILYEPDGPNAETQVYAARGFAHVVGILQRGSRLRLIFMPAMCGLVLQWLRSDPPDPIAKAALAVFKAMVSYLVAQGYHGPDLRHLRQCDGIMFYAKLAGAVAAKWPAFARRAYGQYPDARAVLLELLAIFSDGFPEPSPDLSGGGAGPREAAGSSAGDGSSTPVPDVHLHAHAGETQPEPPFPHSHTGEKSQQSPPAHLCIDVQAEAETEAAEPEVGVNRPASPMANPASSPLSLVSPQHLSPPSG